MECPSEVPNRMKLYLPSALTSCCRILNGLLIFIRYTSWEAVSRMNIRVIQGSETIQEAKSSTGSWLPDLTEDEMCGEFLDYGIIQGITGHGAGV